MINLTFLCVAARNNARRLFLKMLDKRFWQNIIYVVILFVVCVTIWQISTYPEHISNVGVYSLYTSNTSTYSYPIHTLPFDDYHQLINLHNFTFTILNLPCNETTPLLLILVHSDPKNVETRNTLRQTWGRNTPLIKVLFVTGLVRRPALKQLLELENEEYGDLIQGSFYDAYRNMTYKHVMVFKYAIYHCPQAKYILKTDDDVFVNIPLMMNFLNVDLSPYGGSRMLFCTLKRKAMVLRSWRSKWRVSFKEYPAKTYPPYCLGWAILYSPDVVFELYREAQKADYFWIDDVHITGTLAGRIHVNHVDIDNLVLSYREMNNILHQPLAFNHSFLYGAANVKNKEIRALWDYVKSHHTHYSVLRDIP
ncbi:Galactosyl T domain containing protein [Asbolus verrucosus]|uniref:Hexosyltransferase n=1 Tax=Asbolus verrucosus TaxID=1661398 RepID=A0A482VIX4_ASBVE|nr:Galactosyl T domain containing protein [Asbolus verrucosus]